MMKIQIILLFLMIFIIPFSFAQEEGLGSVKLNDCITWKQVSSNATYTNFSSVKVPNGTTTILSPELEATKSGINYYLEQCNYSSQIGTYHLCGHTDVDGIDTNWCYNYEVTPSGADRLNDGEGSVAIIGIIVMLFAGIFFAVLSFKVHGSAWKIVLIGISAVILFSSILFAMLLIDQNLGGFVGIVEGYSTFLMIVRVLLLISVLAILIYAGYRALMLWQIKRGFRDD